MCSTSTATGATWTELPCRNSGKALISESFGFQWGCGAEAVGVVPAGRMHTPVRMHMCPCTHACRHICIHTHTHTLMHACTPHTDKHIYTHATHTDKHIYTHTHTYNQAYTQTHTHAHTHTHPSPCSSQWMFLLPFLFKAFSHQ